MQEIRRTRTITGHLGLQVIVETQIGQIFTKFKKKPKNIRIFVVHLI